MTSQYRGVFIVFEGIDSAGKSTQSRLLHDALTTMGYDPLSTYEPGGSPLGDSVSQLLKSQLERNALAEMLLFNAARAEHVRKVIAPALMAGRPVICDRFSPSTVAYQGYGRGLDIDVIESVNHIATDGLRPDVVILLDVNPKSAALRRQERAEDAIERRDEAFHVRVRDGFLAMAQAGADSWVTIDGAMAEDEIAAGVLAAVKPLLPPR